MILKQAWLRAKMKCEMLAPPEKQLIMDLVAVVVLWLVAHRTLIIPQTLNPCVDLHIMLALSGPSQTSVEGNSLRLAAVVYARANKALASRLYGVPGHLTVPAMLRLNLIYTPPPPTVRVTAVPQHSPHRKWKRQLWWWDSSRMILENQELESIFGKTFCSASNVNHKWWQTCDSHIGLWPLWFEVDFRADSFD